MNVNKIKDSFYNTLINYGWSPTPHAVSKIVDESIKSKNKIIELLRKSPDWFEDELCIVLNHKKLRRKFNTDAIVDFITFLEEYMEIHPENYSKVQRDRLKEVESIIIKNFTAQFFTTGMKHAIDELNSLNSSYRIHYTGKASKAIMKICKEEGLTDIPGFDKEYTKMSEEINPTEKNVMEIISVHPTDFLEMSNGWDYNWKSCHNIRNGEYMAGTVSYAIDHCSFIYYQVPDDTPIEKIHNASRILREVFFYNDECVVQSRLYPQSNDGYSSEDLYVRIRNMVLDVVAGCLNVADDKEPWLTSHKWCERLMQHDYDFAAYPDWEYDNPGAAKCNVSKLRTRKKMLPHFEGGAMQKCICCGCDNYSADSLYCEDCNR